MKKEQKFSLLISLLVAINSFAQLTPTYNDVMIPMSDLKELEADVYIPSGCTSCEVILVQTPYNKDLFEWGLPLGIGSNLDDQPFIWVVVDWRGFYGSAAAAISNPDRGQDGFDVCEWIVDQPWHADRIGTWGPSALGNIQYQLISKHHPNHTCAVPIVASPQFSYNGYFYGGVLEEARLEQLDALGYGLSPIVMANVYYNAYWQVAENLTYYPDDIEIPTLQIGGWYDHNIDEMMTFYKNSRNQAALDVQDEQWLLIGPWVHGGTGIANVGSNVQGELTYPNAEYVNNELSWKFFNYYLLDSNNYWNEHPRVKYYELGTDIWKTSNADDITAIEENVLYLNAGNKLTSEFGINNSQLTSIPSDPAPTIGGATLNPDLDQGPYDQSYLDGRDDIITFETDTFTTPITVTGRIKLKLFISATTPDCDLVVRLVDQYPDGTNMLITDGIKRVRFRNGYTLADESLMTPGEIYEVEVDLPFTNYTWKVDHKLKIYIGSNSSIRWNVNLQDGLEMYTSGMGLTSTITVHHNENYPSRIILPGYNDVLNLETNNTFSSFEIYPNPANENIFIKTENSVQSYILFDVSGRVVQSDKMDENKISIADLPDGIYIAEIYLENGSIVKKKFVVE